MDPTLLLDVTVSGGLTAVQPGSDCLVQNLLSGTIQALDDAIASGRNRICEEP